MGAGVLAGGALEEAGGALEVVAGAARADRASSSELAGANQNPRTGSNEACRQPSKAALH